MIFKSFLVWVVGVLFLFVFLVQVLQRQSSGGREEISFQNLVNPIEELDSNDTVKVTALDLSGRGLDKLPPSVLDKSLLETLDISNNNITGALPAEIRHLRNLRVLDASNNQMTGVPAEVGQLESLEVLNLANNQLTGLPYELGNLKNLKTLNLSGNNYSMQDLEIIKRGLPKDVEIIL